MKLSEILEADSLASARIVAGRDGLDAEVKWSHVVDLPEPLPWVRPGDLLLTTGYSWPKEALEERRLVRELAAAGVSAIALAVPRFVEAFSNAACDEADRSGLPLLEIPWAVPFAGIMEELHRKIMAEPLRTIERSESIHRALTRAAGDGSSLDALAELSARLVGRSVTFEDPGGKLLAHASADDDHDEVRRETLARSQSPRALHAEFERRGVAQQIRTAQRHVRVPAIEGLGMGARLACPIRLGKEVVGVVWILEGKTPLNELDQRAAEHAALVAAIRIAHERELESLESRLGYASFLSFLESDSSAPVAEERLRLLGFDPEASHVAGIVALDLRIPLGREELDERDGAAESVRFALSRLGAPSLVTVTLDRVPFLVPSGFPLSELAAIVDRPARSLVFGRAHAGADGARASLPRSAFAAGLPSAAARLLLRRRSRSARAHRRRSRARRLSRGVVRTASRATQRRAAGRSARRAGPSWISVSRVRPHARRPSEHLALPARPRHRDNRHGRARSGDAVSPAARDAAARYRDPGQDGAAVNALPEKHVAPSRRMEEVLRGPIKSKTVFPVLLLNLISQRADHGYGLMQRIDDICGDLLAVNTNKIYPLLRRLEERGFVTATWDHPTKRSRRIYSITPEGIERLARIKEAMLPYLDSVERAAGRLRKSLYE